ncbi:MAG: hypothetical protein P8098_20800 [Candidatus Thiodiazotropha sp.]
MSVTDEASIANEKQVQSDNPWHHMKGIRQHLKVPGTILPKRLLRPYYLEYPHRIDDKQYVITSLSSLKDGLHFVYGSFYLLAGGVALEWAATLFRGEFEPWMILICLIIGIPLHKYGKTLKRNRFHIYDRETGMVRKEYGWFKVKYHERPFWECEGRIVSAPNHFGLMRHTLFLSHPSVGLGTAVLEGVDCDLPLGFWSFLVQYMDKNKPLPNVQYLRDYPNKEPGLGDWKSWKRKIQNREIADPYEIWKLELSKRPEWDVSNYGRDLSRSTEVLTKTTLIGLFVVIGVMFAIIILFDRAL